MRIKTIIVDDERLERALIRNSIDFESLGFDLVGEAADADSAMKLICSQTVDLVLSDINMPYTDGIELSKQIKSYDPSVEIIILTGYGALETALEAINNVGVHSFLLKPLNKTELENSLKKFKEKFIRGEGTGELPTRKDDRESSADANPADGVGEYTIDHVNPLVRKCIRYIEENFRSAGLSLAKVAGALFINKDYVSRLVKEHTHRTFTEYVTELRLTEAVRLINTMSLSTAEAAAKAGFRDVNYFYKCYKKVTGRTFKKTVNRAP
ncbi:MAG: response regulator [Oscillospiraceae bacterium]|nr:response regulator [Oscillospiraceae bacterium]